MKNILLLVLSIITFLIGNAQNPVYKLPNDIKVIIDQGKNCLGEKRNNCNAHFEKAIALSKTIKNDSVTAQTYFEICNVLDYSGTSEDHIYYAKRGLKLDGKNHPLVTNRLLRELGYAYSKVGKVDSLIPIYHKAIYWAEFAEDSSTIAMSRIRLASAYKRLGDVKKSIEILLDTQVFIEASNDIHRESGLLFTLANSYSANYDNELAIASYEEAAKGFLKAEDDHMYAASLVNLSIVANDIGKHKLALQKLPEAIAIFDKNEPNSALYAKTHLGRAYFLDGAINESITLLKKCLSESIRVNNKQMENVSRKFLAQGYLENGENSLALIETTKTYEDEKQRGISDAYLNTLKLHAEALALNNESTQAVKIYKDYITAKDSLFTKNKEKEIAIMRERFETEKKEAQIELMEKDITLSNTQKTLYAIGMFSFLVISGLLYFGFKQRLKKNRIEREKQEEIYKQEIAYKKKELASQTLHLVQKSTFIQELKENLEKIKKSPELFKVEFRRLVMLLKKESAEDKDWEVFKSYFSEVHNNFDHKIKSIAADISEKEIRLASFLKMNLTTKEIASMLNVLPDSVLKSKYRLKKKLGLDKDTDLTEYLSSL